jgi:hypothetical protein
MGNLEFSLKKAGVIEFLLKKTRGNVFIKKNQG